MKFLLAGDLHIDMNKPERRTDDYWETVQKKVNFILDLAAQEKAVILQPGDFFNSHKANDYLKRWVIERLRLKEINILAVFGQHDLRYHSSDTKNTPLAVLQAAGHVEILSNDPLKYTGVDVYGASWWEEIPKLINTQRTNILVLHKMIIKDEKLWEGQEDATMGNILLKSSGFDLILSGDNHSHFTISTKTGKHLVNCGSLLRTAIDQSDHVPTVYIYDTVKKTITPHVVPHKPFSEVFDLSKYEAEKERDEKLEAFLTRMTGEVELEGLDFIKNMDTYVSQNEQEIDEMTLGIIEEVMA